MFAVVRAFPESAYIAVGALGTVGVQRARAWAGARRNRTDNDGQESAEDTALSPVQVAAACHRLAAPHVHLVPLAEALGTTTEKTREALTEMGVPIAGGVRMKGRGVSPGVRAADLPPLSPDQPPDQEGPLTSNNNSNNTPGGTGKKGSGGRYRFWVTDDPDNPARAHVTHQT